MAIGLGVALLILFCWIFFIHDTWETDHVVEIERLRRDVVTCVHEGRRGAGIEAYDRLVDLVGSRQLSSELLRRSVAEAAEAAEVAKKELKAERAAKEKVIQQKKELAARKKHEEEQLAEPPRREGERPADSPRVEQTQQAEPARQRKAEQAQSEGLGAQEREQTVNELHRWYFMPDLALLTVVSLGVYVVLFLVEYIPVRIRTIGLLLVLAVVIAAVVIWSRNDGPEAKQKSAERDLEAHASAKLKTVLDAWVFSDSPDKFKNEHPDILCAGLGRMASPLMRWSEGMTLSRYEVQASRVLPDRTVEFAVTLVYLRNADVRASTGIDFKSVRFRVIAPGPERSVERTNCWTIE